MSASDVLARVIAWLIAPFAGFVQPAEKMYWLHALGSVLVAMLVFLRAGSKTPFRSIFAREIWGHPSARIDVWWYFLNGMLLPAILLPLLAAQRSGGLWVAARLTETLGERGDVSAPGLWFGIALVVVAALVNDFAIYLPHWLQHRIPLLWQFHKVHHSAQVLTPFTAFRFHPVDDLLNAVCVIGIVGAFNGLVLWRFPFEVVQLTLLDVNAVVFLFYLLGVHLRHSHVWLAYPPAVSQLLISPAMHQIHHSTRVEHYDKNFGLVFSVWDRLFGTLYVPETKLELTFGLGADEEKEFSSVARLYVLPFRKAAALLRRSPEPGKDPAAT